MKILLQRNGEFTCPVRVALRGRPSLRRLGFCKKGRPRRATRTGLTVGSEVVKALLQRGAQPGYEVQGEPHGGYRHV